MWDWHSPWGNDWGSHSDDEMKSECCQKTCYLVMTTQSLTCDVGQMRPMSDHHRPWGSDWSKTDEEIKGECCQINCHSFMHWKGLSCPSGTLRGEWDWHMPPNGWYNSADWQLQSECCEGFSSPTPPPPPTPSASSWNQAHNYCHTQHATQSDSSCCIGADIRASCSLASEDGNPPPSNFRRLLEEVTSPFQNSSPARKLGHCCDHAGYCACMHASLSGGGGAPATPAPCVQVKTSVVDELSQAGYHVVTCEQMRIRRRLKGLDPGPPCDKTPNGNAPKPANAARKPFNPFEIRTIHPERISIEYRARNFNPFKKKSTPTLPKPKTSQNFPYMNTNIFT